MARRGRDTRPAFTGEGPTRGRHVHDHQPAAVTESQRALLARLVGQGRVTIEQLADAGGHMSRPELAAWVEANVIGSPADELTRRAFDHVFEWHSKDAADREPAA